MGLLSLAIWLPIVAGCVLLAIGRDEHAKMVRGLALVAAVASFLVTLPLIGAFDAGTAAMQFQENLPWIERFNVRYHLGIDGLSLWFVPLTAFMKNFSSRLDTSIRVKVKDKNQLPAAMDELTGDMRRVRQLRPEQKDDFSINEQSALRSTLDPIKAGIAMAGLFVTGLALFVGAIGIMNITYVSVKERTREIGTRKAIGAKRRSILLQFLVEAVAICLVGGVCGLTISWALSAAVAAAFPSFPMQFSLGLVFTGLIVSTLTGIFSGFAPALSASRLDPIEALRYE